MDVNTSDTPRIPVFSENEVEAYAFDEHVLSSGLRGHVLNGIVIGIMAFLGVALWLLSDSPSIETLLTLLCTISSSGGQLETLKNRIAFAALAWVAGNLFFSLILVDDMTSSIAVPDNSRIKRMETCAFSTLFNVSDRKYVTVLDSTFWNWIEWNEVAPERRRAVICGTRYGVDRVRRSFDFRNLYRVPLDRMQQNSFIQVLSQGLDRRMACPRNFLALCFIVDSFVDNTEWTEYALMVLQYDLMKLYFRKGFSASSRKGEAAFESKFGPLREKAKRSDELAKLLSQFEPGESRSGELSLESLTIFVFIGCAIGVISIVMERFTKVLRRYV